MEEEYQKALEVIFTYGYGCYVFKHNICGDRPEVPKGMLDSVDPLPPEVFVNHGCPPIQAATEVIETEESPGETAQEPMKIAFFED